MDCPDYYAFLGVPRFYATQEEIRAAYLAQIKFFHPDAGNVPPLIATDRTQVLNRIYEILRDPQKKRAYDEQLAASIQRENQRQQAEKEERERQERIRAEKARAERRKKIVWSCSAVAAVLLIALVAIQKIVTSDNTPGTASQPQPGVSSPSSTPSETLSLDELAKKQFGTMGSIATPSSPALTPVNRPANGTIITGAGLNRVAPLEIKTLDKNDYYVKLVSASTEKTVMAFFVRGGFSTEVDVPLGTYILRYATGETWYGTQNLFGPDTIYYEADDLFTFEDTGTYYSGWTVQLYFTTNGNLDTDRINASEF